MRIEIRKLAKRALLLIGLLGLSVAWAGTTEHFWHDDAGRTPWPDAPHPAEYRALSLETAQVAAYLKAARASGNVVEIALPLPEGGFAEFKVVDSGTMPSALEQKYPDILSFKGSDGEGRRVRLDVSPIGFQAMVFDPDGVWVVRPETLASGTSRYLSFRRAELKLPAGDRYHEAPVDMRGHTPDDAPQRPMTETGAQQRVYRAAVAANHQYIAAVGGGTTAGGLAAVVTAVNRVSEIYEYEMSIQLVLVPDNDLIMYPNASGDPFGSNGTGVINTSTSVISAAIGAGNYDIGHVFTTGSGGVAGLGVVCKSSSKGRGTTGLSNPIGDAFYVDFVAHEMGHQFGGNHPFNGALGNCSGGNRNASTAYEPGSGSTIMAYAGICGADDLQPNSDPFFHAISLQEITNYTNGSGNCSVNTTNPNQAPVIDTGSLIPSGLTIPARTPFRLNASATDPDAGDTLYYSWEEWDLGPQAPLSAGDNGSSPIFRAFPPTLDGQRVFPAMSTVLGGAPKKGETMPTTTRELKFRLTVRDYHVGSGGTPGNGTSQSANVALDVTNSAGPFKVNTPAAGTIWETGSAGSATWDVANTNLAPVNCSNVDIWLSTDGGATFGYTVATDQPNNGAAGFTVPVVLSTEARIGVGCSDNVFFNVSPANFTIAPGGTVYTVGGTVGGLTGSGLILKLNGGNDLPVASDGTFTFAGGLVDGMNYVVTVGTQPSAPPQECTVSNGAGTINGANVTDVAVTCVNLPTYTVGGTITGLTGSGLELKLNGGTNFPVSGTTFTFPDGLLSGASYAVTVGSQPPGQTCTVSNGSGVIGNANVTDVAVDCVDLPPEFFTVGGKVRGVKAAGLVLQLDGGSDLTIMANGIYAFNPGAESGQAYTVSVLSLPTGQACTIANATGTMGYAPVTNVDVTCIDIADDTIFANGFESADSGP